VINYKDQKQKKKKNLNNIYKNSIILYLPSFHQRKDHFQITQEQLSTPHHYPWLQMHSTILSKTIIIIQSYKYI